MTVLLKAIKTLGDTEHDVTDEFLFIEPMQYCFECQDFYFPEDCEEDEDENIICPSCDNDVDSHAEFIESQEQMNELLEHLVKENVIELRIMEVEDEKICN